MNQRAKNALISKTSTSSHRLHFLLVLTVSAFAILSFRLWTIQVFQHEQYKDKAKFNYIRQLPIPSKRGEILDRNGIRLAYDILFYDIWVPVQTEKGRRVLTAEMEETLRILAKYLKFSTQSEEEYYQKLQDKYFSNPTDLFNTKRRVRLEKGVHYTRAVPIIVRQRIEFPPEAPVDIDRVQKRQYPKQDLAAHVLGYTREIDPDELQHSSYSDYKQGDLIGKTGIERQYESYLRGKQGIKQVFVDTNAIQRGQETILEKAEPGYNVMLNLDYNLQLAAETALGASRGVIIVSDPRDNSVLAMASNPRYNPNNYSQHILKYQSDKGNPMYHRAIRGRYEPGSVIKVFEVFALMEELGMKPGHTESCGGSYFYGDIIHCHDRDGHGGVTLTDAVRRSCNIFFYRTVQDLGFQRLYFWMTQFGFNNKTGVDLPYETHGEYPALESVPRYERTSQLIMLAIGQASLILSPLQIHTALCAIANGGKMYPPRIAQKVLPPDISHPDAAPVAEFLPDEEPRKIEASPETWEAVHHAMWEVVNNWGTGRRIKRDDFVLAGKTGTAQNSGPDTHAWFVCYGPFEDPTIAITVLVEHSGHGGEIASPLVVPIIDEYLKSPTIASSR